MTGMKIPVFERGSILTYDMLEQLKDYFMQAVTIPYAEYSDGILCGCRITMSNGIVQLGQGLICFQGKLLAVTDDMQVQVEPSNARQILILNIGSSYRDVNFEVIDVQYSGDRIVCQSTRTVQIPVTAWGVAAQPLQGFFRHGNGIRHRR